LSHTFKGYTAYENNYLLSSSYADDINTYAAIDPDDTDSCAITRATLAVRDWYADNGMLLNGSKSEAVLIGNRAQSRKFSDPLNVSVAGVPVQCRALHSNHSES